MAGDTLWLNAAVLATSLMGFVLLALASERPGELLLQRVPSGRERLTLRVAGWPLLILALALCVWGWGWSIGAVAWLGWLCMASVALIFALPRWTEKRKKAKPGPASPVQPAVHSCLWRGVVASLLVSGPVAFAWGLATTPVQPVLRDDAVRGQIGPWAFVIAEADHKPPVVSDSGVPTKTFQIRFCETCDGEIRTAYFKVRKPRSLRAAGLSFNGSRWTRSVEIAIPPASKLRDQLWLTVEGKDGTVYHHAFDVAQLSPATAAFIQENNP